VSGVGDDVNPCSRTAPCKTFAGAISKTATGGEIDALDPGGYGTLTITKAITVDGGTGQGWASTLFSGSPSGMTVNITTGLTTDKVVLRNISFNGAGTTLGTDGIRFLDGADLTVENCSIQNFSGDGIEVAQTGAGNLYVNNVSITRGSIGINMNGAGGIGGSLRDVRITAMSSHAIQAVTNIFMLVRDVSIDRPGGSGVRVSGNSQLNCEGVTVQGANIGYETANASAVIRLTNCAVYNGNTGISTVGGGNVQTANNNRNAGNATPGAPNGGLITIQ
jgi:hypothetical protein